MSDHEPGPAPRHRPRRRLARPLFHAAGVAIVLGSAACGDDADTGQIIDGLGPVIDRSIVGDIGIPPVDMAKTD